MKKLQKKSKHHHCIKQHDITDCGAACMATIARTHGLKMPISKIREIAGTDRIGTSALGLVKAAKELGFSAKGVKAAPEQLTDNLPLPAIAHVIQNGLLHYVVIHEIGKEHITVADPGAGIVTYSRPDFYKIWSGVLILMVPSEKFEKRDETTGLFARFFYLIVPHKRLIIEIFLASILYTVLGLVGAFYFKFLIDDILTGGLERTLHIVSTGILLLTLFRILMDAFRRHLLLYLSQKIDITLILDYYQHVLDLPISFFDTRKVGEILSRLSDASKIRNAISSATISVMIDTLLVIAGAVVLYIQNTTLFATAAIFIPFYIFVVWSFNKPFQNIHRKSMENAADLESYLVESISGIATVKAFNGEDKANFETEKRFIRLIKAIFRSTWLQNLQSSLQQALTLIGELLILWIGGVQVLRGNMSIGQLITFNALLAYFFQPIQNLVNLQPTLQQAFIAADRLGEIMDLDVEKKDEMKKIAPPKLCGQIEFKDVRFRYGTRQEVLKSINLNIKPGEKIALVGESGSGKTTLVKLILKYYLPEKGEILLDDYNLQDVNIETLREKIGYVPQETFLFSGTIRENIAFGADNVSLEEIIDAAKQAQIHDFINKLPLRYDTLVGERGASLSGGQRQRIAIARVILKKPDILILDEATSSLDSFTERAIHHTIEEISKNTTTIIIAHRLSTIIRSDRIILMDEGQIVEAGNHKELLEKKGRYFELWREQFCEDV